MRVLLATEHFHLGESPPGSLTPSLCWPEQALPTRQPLQRIDASSVLRCCRLP